VSLKTALLAVTAVAALVSAAVVGVPSTGDRPLLEYGVRHR
jgi:hypothetical protein